MKDCRSALAEQDATHAVEEVRPAESHAAAEAQDDTRAVEAAQQDALAEAESYVTVRPPDDIVAAVAVGSPAVAQAVPVWPAESQADVKAVAVSSVELPEGVKAAAASSVEVPEDAKVVAVSSVEVPEGDCSQAAYPDIVVAAAPVAD